MPLNLRGKNLLAVKDWTNAEIKYVLRLSKELKEGKRRGDDQRHLLGNTSKSIVVVFAKTSTRTRSAFETAAFDLGMNVSYVGGTGSQMGIKESIEDTAIVLGRFYDGIAFRGAAQADVEMLGKYAGVPVWNALTDAWHPTQMFADYLTVLEEFGTTKVKFVYFGDARNNMGCSLAIMSAHMGAHFVAAAPKELWPDQKLIDMANEIAEKTGAIIEFEDDPMKAAKDADVLYGDVWVSMGEPEDVWASRIKLLTPYRIDMDKFAVAKPTAIFMHCLPAFHDTNTITGAKMAKKFNITEMEVSDEVFRSKYARQFDQAENRAHTIKAIMATTLGY